MSVLKATASVGRSVVAQALVMLVLAVVLMAVLVGLSSGRAAEGATTFTVNSTADEADINITNGRCDSDGAAGDQCTLRAAIEEANDTSGDDTIDFDIDGTGAVRTISPTSALPTITDTLTIDGYT
jgi:CSLREA domain-containing protein